jgi:hypothetical protein
MRSGWLLKESEPRCLAGLHPVEQRYNTQLPHYKGKVREVHAQKMFYCMAGYRI